jgi:hypothetical protein
MKGFLDIKIPLGLVLILMILLFSVTVGFAYIGSFFNYLGNRFPEFAGSGNWMIIVSMTIVVILILTYIEVTKKRGIHLFRK